MNKSNIFIEAKYGYKSTCRSIIFRMFSILAILGLAIYQYTPLSEISNYYSISELLHRSTSWTSLALPSSIAFKSAYYFIIIQLLFVIGFIQNDSKLSKYSTIEALYVRPQDNIDIVLGRFIGKLFAFAMINGLWFFVSIIINLVFYPNSFELSCYLFYFITLTFPSLVFFLGVSYLASRFIHNQGLNTLILLFLLGGITFWGSNIFQGLLDPSARHIPNMFSDFTGHVNLENYLLQRGCILLTGLGFLVLSIIPYPRIPNSKHTFRNYLCIACILFSTTLMMAFTYHDHYTTINTHRRDFKQVYNEYYRPLKAKIIQHDLHVKELPKGNISVNSKMLLVNKDSTAIPLIFFLNPGLRVNSIKVEGKNISFQRKHQAIIVDKKLKAGEICSIVINYEGRIENSICFLDTNIKEYHFSDVNKYGIYHFGYMPAFCEKKYKLFTPECIWYPVCEPPYSLSGCRKSNFTRYSLKVDHDPRLTAISQGNIIENSPGETSFTFEHDMSGISLCIGKYKKRVIMVDSTRLQVYYLPNHEYLGDKYDIPERELIEKLSSTKMGLESTECTRTKEFMSNLYEGKITIDPVQQYPYRWFTFLEVPCNFYSFPTLIKLTGAREQGGILFVPEKGYSLNKYTYNTAKNSDDYNPYFLLDKDIEMLFDENSCDIKPVLRGKTSYILSEEYPIINEVLSDIANKFFTPYSFSFNDYSVVEYLKNKSLKDALFDDSLSPDEIRNIVSKKSMELQAYIMSSVGREEFCQFYIDFLTDNLFKEITLEELFLRFQQTFGTKLDSIVRNWYYADQLPYFEIKDARLIKIEESEESTPSVLYCFKVFNKSDVSGIVMTGDYQGWIIPPHEGREIRTYNQGENISDFVGMPLAQNIPGTVRMKLENLKNISTDFATGVFSLDSTVFLSQNDEIIVDNEDPGFRVVQAKGFNILSFFRKEKKRHEKYQEFCLENKWFLTIDEHFYGSPVRSALHTLEGDGSKKVEWNVELPHEGRYEVFFYYSTLFESRRDVKQEFHYTVFDGEKEHEVIAFVSEKDKGWVSLGEFDFLKTSKVVLSDKGRKNYIDDQQGFVADAIKWVKMKQ